MAHIDWTKSSSRVVQPKALLNKYDTDNGNIIYNATNQSSNTVKWITDKDGYITGVDSNGVKTEDGLKIQCMADVSASATSSNYLQIVGDKASNGYPVDFQITNVGLKNDDQTAITFNMTNNNSYNCIIKHDSNNEFPINFYVTILKWSLPNKTLYVLTDDNIETVITHIGFDVRFDLVGNGMVASAMNPLIEMPYDGTNDLQYGIKTSQFNLTLNKDTPNTGYQYNIEINEIYNGFGIYSNVTTDTRPSVGFQKGIVSKFNDTDDGFFIKGNKYYYSIGLKVEASNSSLTRKFANVFMYADLEIGNIGSTIFESEVLILQKVQAYDMFTGIWDCDVVAGGLRYGALIPEIRNGDVVSDMTMGTYKPIMIDLTSIFGKGNEPTIDWCNQNITRDKDGNVTISGKIGYETEIKKFNYSFVSKSKFIVENVNNEYVSFGLKLDTENKFTDIGRYFVTATDYNENGKTFNVTFKDNTKLLQENIMPVIAYASADIKTTNELFNRYINNNLKDRLELEFGTFDLINLYSLPRVQYPYNVSYMSIYKKLCETVLTNIYQDVTNIRWLTIQSAETPGTYEIHNNQCYSLKLYNNINNSVNNISYNTLTYNDSQDVVDRTDKVIGPIYTTTLGYMNAQKREKDETYQQIVSWETVTHSPGAYLYILIPKISSETIEFVLPISDYDVNRTYSLLIYGARARYITDEHLTYVPSEDGIIKKYIHIDENGNEVLVNNVNSLSDSDYQEIKNIDILSSKQTVSDDKTTAVLTFKISFNSIIDSYENSTKKYKRIISSASLSHTYYDENYLGVYRAVLMSTGPESLKKTTVTQTFTTGNGNLYETGENEFIQTDSTVGDTGMSIAAYNANKILKEFRTNKSVVELEWIGSPYIRLNDVIKLDNGLSYRVYYIENKIDGGYRQKLKLVQKEDS